MSMNWLRFTLGSVLAAMLAACGGGGDSDSNVNSEDPTGKAEVVITDAPSLDYQNVWITTQEVWFSQVESADSEDPGWLKFTLAEPVSVDLIPLANGNLADAFANLDLPVGTYRQIRVFLLDPEDPLASSAQAAGLDYNAEVVYLDEEGGTEVAPLELVAPAKGVAIYGRFEIVENQTLTLALDFDVAQDVIEFPFGDDLAFILRPRLAYYDLSSVGAIEGRISASLLPETEDTSEPWGVVVKAESLLEDGSAFVIERVTRIREDGSFTLFPIQIPEGVDQAELDLVIRGRNMATMIVRNVPVVAGSAPDSGTPPTQLQTEPLDPVAATEFTANIAADTPLSPTAGDLRFFQSVGGEAPYLVRRVAVNPFTGILVDDLPLAAGPVLVGEYNGGAAVSFESITPAEGESAYRVVGDAPLYEPTVSSDLVFAGEATEGLSALTTVPALEIAAPAAPASISGTLTQDVAGRYDRGYLMVSRGGDIVTTLDLTAVLAQNDGSGGAFSIENIPGGSSSDTFEEGVYRLYARVWNAENPALSLRRRPLGEVVDLGNGSVSDVELNLDAPLAD